MKYSTRNCKSLHSFFYHISICAVNIVGTLCNTVLMCARVCVCVKSKRRGENSHSSQKIQMICNSISVSIMLERLARQREADTVCKCVCVGVPRIPNLCKSFSTLIPIGNITRGIQAFNAKHEMESNGEKGKPRMQKRLQLLPPATTSRQRKNRRKMQNFNRDGTGAYVCVFILWGCSGSEGSKSTEMLKSINPI